jgi:hypothetical protein
MFLIGKVLGASKLAQPKYMRTSPTVGSPPSAADRRSDRDWRRTNAAKVVSLRGFRS